MPIPAPKNTVSVKSPLDTPDRPSLDDLTNAMNYAKTMEILSAHAPVPANDLATAWQFVHDIADARRDHTVGESVSAIVLPALEKIIERAQVKTDASINELQRKANASMNEFQRKANESSNELRKEMKESIEESYRKTQERIGEVKEEILQLRKGQEGNTVKLDRLEILTQTLLKRSAENKVDVLKLANAAKNDGTVVSFNPIPRVDIVSGDLVQPVITYKPLESHSVIMDLPQAQLAQWYRFYNGPALAGTATEPLRTQRAFLCKAIGCARYE